MRTAGGGARAGEGIGGGRELFSSGLERTVEPERASVTQAIEAGKAGAADKLTMVADKRGAQAFGWSDRGAYWQACSPTLQTLVGTLAQSHDGAEQRRIVDRVLETPGVVDQLEAELSQYHKELSRDRGHSR